MFEIHYDSFFISRRCRNSRSVQGIRVRNGQTVCCRLGCRPNDSINFHIVHEDFSDFVILYISCIIVNTLFNLFLFLDHRIVIFFNFQKRNEKQNHPTIHFKSVATFVCMNYCDFFPIKTITQEISLSLNENFDAFEILDEEFLKLCRKPQTL